MLQAVKHIRSIGIGVTKPHIMLAEDGHFYVVKFMNNKLGPKALANEFIGSWLGKRLELDFPKAEPIELSPECLRKNPGLAKYGIESGIHFAIRYLKHSDYVTPWQVRRAVNLHEFAGVILFDHIVQNEDRTLNRRNLLVRQESAGIKLYAIDNTHLFGSGCWRSENLYRYRSVIRLNNRRVYGLLLRHCLRLTDFSRYAQAFQNITDEQYLAMLEALPPAWLNAADRQAVVDFLLWRSKMTDEIVAAIAGLIPDKHRRTNSNHIK